MNLWHRWFRTKQETMLYPLVLVKDKDTDVVLERVMLTFVPGRANAEITATWYEIPKN